MYCLSLHTPTCLCQFGLTTHCLIIWLLHAEMKRVSKFGGRGLGRRGSISHDSTLQSKDLKPESRERNTAFWTSKLSYCLLPTGGCSVTAAASSSPSSSNSSVCLRLLPSPCWRLSASWWSDALAAVSEPAGGPISFCFRVTGAVEIAYLPLRYSCVK